MNRFQAWWRSMSPAQRLLIGAGVPLAAVAAIISSTRRRPADDDEETAKTSVVAASGPQTFQSSPFDLARLTAALSADDGTSGTVTRPPATPTTPTGPDLSSMTVVQLQAQCETAPGGEPYLSELLRRQVSVNDPGFKRPDGRATTCGAFYVLRLLQAGAVPA